MSDADRQRRNAELLARLRTFTRDRALEARVAAFSRPSGGELALGDRRLPFAAEVSTHAALFAGDRVLAWLDAAGSAVARVQLVERGAVEVEHEPTRALLDRHLVVDLHGHSAAEIAGAERILAALGARPDIEAALAAALPGPAADRSPPERRAIELLAARVLSVLERLPPPRAVAFAVGDLEDRAAEVGSAMLRFLGARAAVDAGVLVHLFARPHLESAVMVGLGAILPDGLPAELEAYVVGFLQHPSAGVRFAAVAALARTTRSPEPLVRAALSLADVERFKALEALARFPDAYRRTLRRGVAEGWSGESQAVAGLLYTEMPAILGHPLPDLDLAFALGDAEIGWDSPAALADRLSAWPALEAAIKAGPGRIVSMTPLSETLAEVQVAGGGGVGRRSLYRGAHEGRAVSTFVVDGRGRATLRPSGGGEIHAGGERLYAFGTGGYPYGASPTVTEGRLLPSEATFPPLLPPSGDRTCLGAGRYLAARVMLALTRVAPGETPPPLPAWAQSDDEDEENNHRDRGSDWARGFTVPVFFSEPFADARAYPARVVLLPAHADPGARREPGEIGALATWQEDSDREPPEVRIYAVAFDGERALFEAAERRERAAVTLVCPLSCAGERARWIALLERLSPR